MSGGEFLSRDHIIESFLFVAVTILFFCCCVFWSQRYRKMLRLEVIVYRGSPGVEVAGGGGGEGGKRRDLAQL